MLEKKGLVKLTEECGELIQIASKKQTCMDTDIHYDGLPIASRLEDEIGDVLAIVKVVSDNFDLNHARISNRIEKKIELFQKWMREENK